MRCNACSACDAGERAVGTPRRSMTCPHWRQHYSSSSGEKTECWGISPSIAWAGRFRTTNRPSMLVVTQTSWPLARAAWTRANRSLRSMSGNEARRPSAIYRLRYAAMSSRDRSGQGKRHTLAGGQTGEFAECGFFEHREWASACVPPSEMHMQWRTGGARCQRAKTSGRLPGDPVEGTLEYTPGARAAASESVRRPPAHGGGAF
jgi:hypothetical protein